MFKTGYHVKQQKIWAGSDNTYSYYDYIIWVQWRVTILAIPVFVKNLKGFGSVSSALSYIREMSK